MNEQINALLADFPVVVEQDVNWGDMDSYQHVNNVIYFRYFENARVEYLRRLGWPELQQETGVGPIVSELRGRFRKPLVYPDKISIGAKLGTMGEDRFSVQHIIVSHNLQAVATEGECTVVCFQYEENRKSPIPDLWKQRIEDVEASRR